MLPDRIGGSYGSNMRLVKFKGIKESLLTYQCIDIERRKKSIVRQ